jgi:membrane protein DedA with SNARE-associated domain
LIEGILTPIPSEIIIPFAGFLAAEGTFWLPLVIIVGTIGSTLGSTVAYYIGYYLGRPFVLKYGRWFGVKTKHVDKAENWFKKYGDVTVLVSHSLPGTRSFISFPAGIVKMRLRNFVIFTFFGALIWTTILAVAGYYLGLHWESIGGVIGNLELLILAVLLVILIVFIWWVWRSGKEENEEKQKLEAEKEEKDKGE